MTISKTVAIAAALLLLVLNTVSAQDDWDALDDDEEESDDEYGYEDDEGEGEGDEEPPPEVAFPDQARDEEGFIEPLEKKKDDEEKTSSEEMPLPVSSPKEDKPISIGLLVGYGFSFEDGTLNRFGLGFGIRGGYTFDFGVYAGAKFLYYLGGEEGTKTSNIITAGVEGGYKLELEPVLFVPALELGLAFYGAENSADVLNPDESSTEFYLAPGLSVIYPIDMFFFGLDLSVPIIFRDPTIAGLSIMATFGLSF